MDFDIIPKTKDFGLHRYLDIIRGATYSVLLGIILKGVITEKINGPYFYLLLLVTIILVYFILDGVARFISRDIVRYNYIQKNEFILAWDEVICFSLELVGLLVFACWSYSLFNSYSIKHTIFFGIFAIITAIHNIFIIRMDKGIYLWNFLTEAITKDASEINNISNRWEAFVSERRKKILTDYIKKFGHHGKKINEAHGVPTSETAYSSKQISAIHKKSSRKLGKYHLYAQIIALHFIHINLIVGLLIILTYFWGIMPVTILSFWVIIGSTVALFFLSLYCYSNVGSYEIDRLDFKTGMRSGDSSEDERYWQKWGNIALISFIVALYWFFSIYGHAIKLLFLEQFLIGIISILLAKRGEIDIDQSVENKISLNVKELEIISQLLQQGLRATDYMLKKITAPNCKNKERN